MSTNIGIIFDNLIILWCEMESQKILRFCDIIHYAVTPLSGLAVNIVEVLST